MSLAIDRLKAELLDLSSLERAELAHLLIASLDSDPDEDPVAVDRAWDAEITRRLAAFRSGTATTTPAADVFAQARARLR
jgi:putative addiction module component (TIGR02574 family)